MTKTKVTEPAFELTNDGGASTVRYSEHGSPSNLIRWHIHDDYELHLITATQGKFFAGDFIGSFGPGQLVLTGPRLPHNWVSNPDYPTVALRDQLVHFDASLFSRSIDLFPEFKELEPLWSRSGYGIEFLNFSLRKSQQAFQEIKDSKGLERTIRFLELLCELSAWSDYRLLSTIQFDVRINELTQQKINSVIDYVFTNYASTINLSDVASLVGMTESYFSGFFRKSTGTRFVEFLNRVRISRACTLLVNTDQQITSICFDVGFNNVANFNRHFHGLKGVTPSEYRLQSNNLHSQSVQC